MESKLAQPAVSTDEITAAIQDFEDAHQVLLTGRTGRRLQDQVEATKTDVLPSSDAYIVKLLEDTASAFGSMKDTLTGMVAEGATMDSLRSLVDGADGAASAMEQSLLFFASKLELTVLEPISILAPVPLTGAWNAGLTMRLSARVAEGLINDEQLILPAYAVNHVFFDDKCDPTASSQIVLSEMKSAIHYVGLGGSGCSAACAGTAFVASSIRLPYLSYECAGASLSDTTSFPDFTRFGTVTSSKVDLIQQIGKQFADWSFVSIISGDPAKYRDEAQEIEVGLQERGLQSSYAFAYETKWDEIVDVLNSLRLEKRRVIFVMGSESYFRKVVCASIVVEANKGITWLSHGAWRDEWWKRSDAIIDSHRTWIKEDSEKEDTKDALADFIRGWNSIGATDEERFEILQPLYATEMKDELFVIDAPEAYHSFHKTWHPVYRKQMLERNYYDVFMFDLSGNMVYSVFKEPDYATNFGSKKSTNVKFAEWQGSGLGDAFRAARSEPDVVTLTPWTPYGPSAGALASFLATGVRSEAGSLIGVFSTQMPPDAMSIDNVEPECSLENIADSFEGAINFVGLGQPLQEDMEKQVPCFKGKTARAFMEVLDEHFAQGFPKGDEVTAVLDPYKDIRMHAVDGTCVFAYAVRHLMKDFSLYDIEKHTEEVYGSFINYIKNGIDFQGVSGQVKFSANDRPAYLAVHQVQQGSKILVGTCSQNISVDLTVNGGPSNASWKPAHPDAIPAEESFPYVVFQILIPLLCLCCPALAACIRNF